MVMASATQQSSLAVIPSSNDFGTVQVGSSKTATETLTNSGSGKVTRIRKARPDVKAVIHSHSPAVIPFGTTQVPMQPMFHISAFLSPQVPVFEIRKVGGMTDMLVSNAQLGKALAEALGRGAVVLMRGHGMAVAGPSLPLAVFRAIYTEVNARLQTQAIEIGGPITFLAPEESEKADKVIDQVHLRAWDLWKREEMAKSAK